MLKSEVSSQKGQIESLQPGKYVYGLKGLSQLLGGVSIATALRYKKMFLSQAVIQAAPHCRVIIDAEKALSILKNDNPRTIG